MIKRRSVSNKTRNNWFVDAFLFVSALTAAISGIYFLYLPNGGYQGGRNPLYGITVLFQRSTWGDLHIWGGVLMIIALLVHIPLHWEWVTQMTRRIFRFLTGRSTNLNKRSQFNVLINMMIGLSFLVTAITGMYLLFVPGGPQAAATDPVILFSRSTWDLIHSWSGVLLTLSAVVHFAIHWGWVVKVTRKLWTRRLPWKSHRVSAPQVAN
jgi:hypothetical protein